MMKQFVKVKTQNLYFEEKICVQFTSFRIYAAT